MLLSIDRRAFMKCASQRGPDLCGRCAQQPNAVEHVQTLKAVLVKINGKPFEA